MCRMKWNIASGASPNVVPVLHVSLFKHCIVLIAPVVYGFMDGFV
jgi:hypothetical protein